jgi:acyl-CoA thioesterase FadM
VGRRSAVFRYVGFRQSDGQEACSAAITCACVDLDRFSAREVPEDLERLFKRFAT